MSHSDIAARIQALLDEADRPVVLIEDVTRAYRQDILHRYGKRTGRYQRLSNLMDLIDDFYCDQPADSFGPKRLAVIRDELIKAGNSRAYINEQIRYAIKIFRYAVSQELIGAHQVEALRSLEPLRRGEAPDRDPKAPVTLELIEATYPFLRPQLKAMVRIQLGTGARPSEVFAIYPEIVDRSNPRAWWIRPSKHKTAHHGIKKAIPLIGDARDALTPYLFRDPTELCFQTRRGNPWNANTYRCQIHKACDKAGVEKWSPRTVRHLAAQVVRERLGLESARSLLGHTSTRITEKHYAELTEREALEAARVTPKLGNGSAAG